MARYGQIMTTRRDIPLSGPMIQLIDDEMEAHGFTSRSALLTHALQPRMLRRPCGDPSSPERAAARIPLRLSDEAWAALGPAP